MLGGADFQEFGNIGFVGSLQVISGTTVVRDIKSNFLFQHLNEQQAQELRGQVWRLQEDLQQAESDAGVSAVGTMFRVQAAYDDGYDPDAQTSGPAAEGAGGLQLPHGRTWGLHLCLDFDDIYHPYPCMLGTTPQRWNGNGDLTDFMILDPLSFVYNPVKYEDEVCAAHEAGDCDWYNYMSLPVSISGVPAGDGRPRGGRVAGPPAGGSDAV